MFKLPPSKLPNKSCDVICAFLFVATDRTCAQAICVIDSSSQVPELTGRSKLVLGYVTTKVTRGTLNRYIVPL